MTFEEKMDELEMLIISGEYTDKEYGQYLELKRQVYIFEENEEEENTYEEELYRYDEESVIEDYDWDKLKPHMKF